MSNDLIKKDDLQLALSGIKGESLGLEEATRSDIKMAVYSLIQPTANEFAAFAGQFVDRSTGESKEKIRCVLLKMNKLRNLWPKPFAPGDKRLCWSTDGKKPSKDVESPVSEMCCFVDPNSHKEEIVCFQAQFDPETNSPACKLSYTFTALDLDTMQPFIISFKGSSVGVIKSLITLVVKHKANLFDAVVTFSAVKPETIGKAKGNYFIIQTDIKWIEEDETKKSLREIFNQLQGIKPSEIVDKKENANAAEEAPF